MRRYSVRIPNRVVYSLGDTHGCGREVIKFVLGLELRAMLRHDESPAFIQLGDLCDGFAFPEGVDDEGLKALSRQRVREIPELARVLMNERNHFVDWRRDEGVRGQLTGRELLDSTEHDVITATYQALRCFETLLLYARFQRTHRRNFFVLFGNHDADLIRGRCAYGRQQKYLLFGLLGLSPDAVIRHMTEGLTRRVLRNPWIKWLNQRPHIALSADTVYMHGGPTGALSERLAASHDFDAWLGEADAARSRGVNDPMFDEHHDFLSPDGAPNDWLMHPTRVTDFLEAAERPYLAVGHSPFLDFKKGPVLDLSNPSEEMRFKFRTPAQLPPEGRLIKHDTDMKRHGELWACRHVVGSDVWTGIDAQFCETPLRRG